MHTSFFLLLLVASVVVAAYDVSSDLVVPEESDAELTELTELRSEVERLAEQTQGMSNEVERHARELAPKPLPGSDDGVTSSQRRHETGEQDMLQDTAKWGRRRRGRRRSGRRRSWQRVQEVKEKAKERANKLKERVNKLKPTRKPTPKPTRSPTRYPTTPTPAPTRAETCEDGKVDKNESPWTCKCDSGFSGGGPWNDGHRNYPTCTEITCDNGIINHTKQSCTCSTGYEGGGKYVSGIAYPLCINTRINTRCTATHMDAVYYDMFPPKKILQKDDPAAKELDCSSSRYSSSYGKGTCRSNKLRCGKDASGATAEACCTQIWQNNAVTKKIAGGYMPNWYDSKSDVDWKNLMKQCGPQTCTAMCAVPRVDELPAEKCLSILENGECKWNHSLNPFVNRIYAGSKTAAGYSGRAGYCMTTCCTGTPSPAEQRTGFCRGPDLMDKAICKSKAEQGQCRRADGIWKNRHEYMQKWCSATCCTTEVCSPSTASGVKPQPCCGFTDGTTNSSHTCTVTPMQMVDPCTQPTFGINETRWCGGPRNSKDVHWQARDFWGRRVWNGTGFKVTNATGIVAFKGTSQGETIPESCTKDKDCPAIQGYQAQCTGSLKVHPHDVKKSECLPSACAYVPGSPVTKDGDNPLVDDAANPPGSANATDPDWYTDLINLRYTVEATVFKMAGTKVKTHGTLQYPTGSTTIDCSKDKDVRKICHDGKNPQTCREKCRNQYLVHQLLKNGSPVPASKFLIKLFSKVSSDVKKAFKAHENTFDKIKEKIWKKIKDKLGLDSDIKTRSLKVGGITISLTLGFDFHIPILKKRIGREFHLGYAINRDDSSKSTWYFSQCKTRDLPGVGNYAGSFWGGKVEVSAGVTVGVFRDFGDVMGSSYGLVFSATVGTVAFGSAAEFSVNGNGFADVTLQVPEGISQAASHRRALSFDDLETGGANKCQKPTQLSNIKYAFFLMLSLSTSQGVAAERAVCQTSAL